MEGKPKMMTMNALLERSFSLYPELKSKDIHIEYEKKGKTRYVWGNLQDGKIGIVGATICITGKETQDELLDVLSFEIRLLTGRERDVVKESLVSTEHTDA